MQVLSMCLNWVKSLALVSGSAYRTTNWELVQNDSSRADL